VGGSEFGCEVYLVFIFLFFMVDVSCFSIPLHFAGLRKHCARVNDSRVRIQFFKVEGRVTKAPALANDLSILGGWFRLWGSGFRVKSSGFRVQEFGLRV